MATVKRVIDIDGLGVNPKSLKAMVSALGNIIGDEVYFRPVLEIQSSENVLKSLDSIIESIKAKSKKVNE